MTSPKANNSSLLSSLRVLNQIGAFILSELTPEEI